MTVRILVGNALDKLKGLPSESVHCVVTSPPYWGLRSYGVDATLWGGDPACEHDFVDETIERQIRKGMGLEELSKRYRGGGKKHGKIATFQIHRGSCLKCGCWRGDLGLEPTPELFIEHMVEIFGEVHRVLRDDGTLWLNIGDCYVSSPPGNKPGTTKDSSGLPNSRENLEMRRSAQSIVNKTRGNRGLRLSGSSEKNRAETMPPLGPNRSAQNNGLKNKDLVGIPWMLAFALRASGWYLRMDNIWHKPNPMPESIEDRTTKSHEYLFHLSKSADYYYDAEAIKEKSSDNSHPRKAPDGSGPQGISPKSIGAAANVRAKESWHASTGNLVAARNKRSVWTVATKPFPEAHFATFPPDLIEPCILAGTSERGCCPRCSTPWRRVVAPTERYLGHLGRGFHDHADPLGKSQMANRGNYRQNAIQADGLVGKETETIGWYPGCDCDGLAKLPRLPPNVRESDHETTAAYDLALDGWRVACRAVYSRWREMCLPAALLSTVPAVVLDPFGGAGTTGLVADRARRDAVLCELNPEYAAMATKRIDADGGMFAKVAAE